MPRDGSGVFSKAAPSVEPNTTIASAVFNAVIDDFVNDANLDRPVAAGGTGASTAADARTNLGVAKKQTGTTDTTAGSGLIVGAFGLGSDEPPLVADFHDYTLRNGLYRWEAASSLNPPAGTGGGGAIFLRRTSWGVADWIATRNTGINTKPEVYIKTRSGTPIDWGSWSKVVSLADVVGTVSQDSGVPTGALFQTGSGANGEYVRFANGLQVCWKATLELTFGTADHCVGTWTFPAAFADASKVFVGGLLAGGSTVADGSANLGSGDVGRDEVGALAVGPRTTTTAVLRVFRQSGASNFQSGDALYAAVFAIGKWF